MKVKFISVGQNFVNFIAETDNVTYRWLWEQVKPYFASTTVDCRFISDFEGKIYAGFQEVGRFEVIDNE